MIKLEELKHNVKTAAELIDGLVADLEAGVEEDEHPAIQAKLDEVEQRVTNEFKPQVAMVQDVQHDLQAIREKLVQALHITQQHGFNPDAFAVAKEGIQGMVEIAKDTDPHYVDIEGLKSWEMFLAQELSEHASPEEVEGGLKLLLKQWDVLAEAYNAGAPPAADLIPLHQRVPEPRSTDPPRTEPPHTETDPRTEPDPTRTDPPNPVGEEAAEILPRVQEALAKLEAAKEQLTGLPELLARVEENIDLLQHTEENLRLYTLGIPENPESARNLLAQTEDSRLPAATLLLSEVERALEGSLTPDQKQLKISNAIARVRILLSSFESFEQEARRGTSTRAEDHKKWVQERIEDLKSILADHSTPEAFNALLRYSTGKENLEAQLEDKRKEL